MHSSPRITTWLVRLIAVVILGARASAQVNDLELRERVFSAVRLAQTQTDYRAVQVRRVRGSFSGLGRGGEWVSAVETAVHRSASTSSPELFALELTGFEGVSMSEAQLQQRRRLYQGQAGYLFRYQSFTVHDARVAAANYSLFDLGVGATHAGRACNRIAIVSRSLDRPSWLIDLDVATSLPLYSGEFTPGGALVSELEVLCVNYGAAAQIPAGSAWAWTPRLGVQHFATVSAAIASAPGLTAIAPDIGAGYRFDHARLITDPLTTEQSVVSVHHDGIDSLMFRQRMQPQINDPNHVLKVFTDAGVTQCMFQHKSTEMLVIGRCSLVREIAKRIYVQAVATL